MKDRYDFALQLLREFITDRKLLFAVYAFKYHASSALIAADLGDGATAMQHAAQAIEAAATQSSGLRYHPGLGLVGSKFDDVRASMFAILRKRSD